MSVFDELHPLIRSALGDFGFVTPTLPQKQVIPWILKGAHVLLIAPTGSGKTESAMLPIFHRILEGGREKRGVLALYITPLRALNRDMLSRLSRWGEMLGITLGVRHGDTSAYERQKQSCNPPDVLITTPETLQIMLSGKRLRANLESVAYVIVDEVHELATSKRGSQLSVALERLVEVCGEFQRIGLSATVGNPEEVARFLGGVGRSVEIVRVDMFKQLDFEVVCPLPTEKDRELSKKLNCTVELASHVRVIREIVKAHASTLIFVNTREAAEALASRFCMLGENFGVHHGSLSRQARIEAEEDFKAGKLEALICTSSMELGIDIGNVDHVIQYMSPREVSRLIQRVGRSGHQVERISSGTIITTSEDDSAEAWAITCSAARGEVEEIVLHEAPTDVLANQLCALALEYRELPLQRAYRIIRRAYPYRTLEYSELVRVAEQIVENRLVWLEERGGEVLLGRRRRSFQHFYENLSMIPDERKYEVLDIVSGRFIGVLDEAFIVNFARMGAVFIAKGEMWRILEVLHDKNRVKVEPVRDPRGEIPNWTGEEIPVPFSIAQETGAIRRRIADMLSSGRDTISYLLSHYSTDLETAGRVIDLIRRQLSSNTPVPTDKTITIEADDNVITINVCAGHRVNETLARVLTALLTTRMGASVAMELDPYRIKLTLPQKTAPAQIKKMLEELQPEYLQPIIEMTLKNTSLLKWKMIHVARKYAALSLDVDYERISMRKLLEIFQHTPMYEEAVREILHDKLDIATTRKLIQQIHAGNITLKISKPSPIGQAGFTGGRDLISPEHADATIIQALKNRIMEDQVILFCLHCKQWKSRRKVKQVPEAPTCPLCNSRMVAALKPWEEEEIKIIKKQTRNKEEEKQAQRVYKNANLVLSHGRTAVIALASRGVGPDTASKVISRMRKKEEDFYRDILEAERNYARTKRFWN
jgi:ATP-dependent Lhr-like helicase